jgi:hypothetical protein
MADEKNFDSLAESSAKIDARGRASKEEPRSRLVRRHSREIPRCKIYGDRSRHRDETTLGGCICGDARLAEIVVYRSIKDDASYILRRKKYIVE